MDTSNQPLDSLETNNSNNSNDELGTGLKVVSFCFPIVGAIIYFTTNAADFPNKKKEACNFALYGMGLGIAIRVLLMLVNN